MLGKSDKLPHSYFSHNQRGRRFDIIIKNEINTKGLDDFPASEFRRQGCIFFCHFFFFT